MNNQNLCPKCGNEKKPWFKLCFECNEKEKQIPRCDVCGVEVPEGHTLCKTHWKEKQEEKTNLKKIEYVKDKKQEEFREKFEGKYYFNGQKVKSKSELLLLYFFQANNLLVQYETCLYLNDKEYRPDFVIEKGENTIIIEHFGLDDENYIKTRDAKIKEYEKLTKENSNFDLSINKYRKEKQEEIIYRPSKDIIKEAKKEVKELLEGFEELEELV